MVTGSRKLITISDAIYILENNKNKPISEIKNEMENFPRHRAKAIPPPAGSISMNAAGIKYGIHPTTILKWVKKGTVPVVMRTANCTYVNEASVISAKNNSPRLS